MTAKLSETERTYLRGQRLGRLATVDPAGRPQASPEVIRIHPDRIHAWGLTAEES